MKLDRLFVYLVEVKDRTSENLPLGGEITVSKEVKSIFEPSFLGNEKGGPKKQPFHFNFGGSVRKNYFREIVIDLLNDPQANIDKATLKCAQDLKSIIDDRVGDLLLAIGLGWTNVEKKCVFWVFPSDKPIQLLLEKGKPKLTEIERAFTRKSKYRKAAYFQGPINVTRNDFIRGEIIDSTRQGKSRSVAHYWVEKFLYGQIALSSSEGLRHLLRALKKSQKKAKTYDEQSSVLSSYTRLLSGSLNRTTLAQFSNMLVGEAKKEYLDSIPHTIEQNAVFEFDVNEVKQKLNKNTFKLENGILIVFPISDDIDPNDYIYQTDEGKKIRIEGIIESQLIE